MAIRLEKSGELYLIRGTAEPPAKAKRTGKAFGLWVVLMLLAMGVLFPNPIASGWPLISHTIKGFLAVVR